MAVRLHAADWAPALVLLAFCAAIGLLVGFDPRLGLIGALGLAFVLLTFADLAIGAVLFIAVVFAETTPAAGSLVSFTKLAGGLLALAWLGRLATRRAGAEPVLFADRPVLTYALAAFLAWIVVSLTWVENQPEALADTTSFLLVAVLYSIMYTAAGTRRGAVIVTAGFVAAAAATAAYGLILRPSLDAVDTGRLVSTVEDPNYLAASLIAGLSLSAFGMIAARGYPLWRLAAAACVGVCLAAFLFTGSRGGVVAFVVVLLASVMFAGRWRSRAALVAAILAVGVTTFFTVYAPPEIRDRITGVSQGEAREESRYTVWTVGWRMVEDHTTAGVGIGQFQERSADYVLEPGSTPRTDQVVDRAQVAHNAYLGVLAELGVIGLALFLTIVGASFWSAVTAARTFAYTGDWRMDALSRGVAVAMAGWLAAAFFISAETAKTGWILLALGPALLGVARSDRSAPDDGQPRTGAWAQSSS